MKIDIITIFPNIFDSFLRESLLARAQKKKLIKINLHNLRKWTDDKHKTVDGRPYGGGAGMVLKIEPIFKAVKSLSSYKVHKVKKTRIILLSAKGKTFDQKKAVQLSKYDQVIFICGRYEGVDERVAKHVADEEISIGNYVLFGGEVPTMVIIETISRLIPGVVAKEESVKNESFSVHWKLKNENWKLLKEHPHYTRPEVFELKEKSFGKSFDRELRTERLRTKKLRVPKILLSGNHKKIDEWRNKNSK